MVVQMAGENTGFGKESGLVLDGVGLNWSSRRVATYRKLRKVSSRVPKTKMRKRERRKGKKRSKRKKGLPSS